MGAGAGVKRGQSSRFGPALTNQGLSHLHAYFLGCGESLGWGTCSGGHLFRGGESRDRGQHPCTPNPGATQRMVGVTVGFKVGTLLFSVQFSL